MGRMHLKSRKRVFYKRMCLVFAILIMLSIIVIKVSNNVFDVLLNYAVEEVRKISSVIINNSVDDDVLKVFDDYEFFSILKNDNNEIEMIDYNSRLVNVFLKDITNNIQKELLNVENGDYTIINKGVSEEKILFYVPFGIVFNNPILNNMGPRIPVRIDFVGSVLTNVSTNIKEYGINNSLIEMTIHIEVREKIILPIVSREIIVTNDIPLSYKIMTGKIPNYYGGGINKSSSIYSIPIE